MHGPQFMPHNNQSKVNQPRNLINAFIPNIHGYGEHGDGTQLSLRIMIRDDQEGSLYKYR